MHKASFYLKKENEIVKCELCPNKCVLKVNKIGKCMVRKNIDGELYNLSYGKISSMSLDPIEKKPIYQYKPKSKVYSIGSYGCNFTCDFCQNHHIAQNKPKTIYMSPEDVIKKAKEKKDNIGIAYTYNEPLINFEFIYDCSKLAKDNNLDNILVTNGYINSKPLKKILPLIDAVNIDIKAFNNQFYKDICDGNLSVVKKNIKLAYEYTHVELTLLLIDDLNTNKEELKKLFQWIGRIDKNIVLHITRYFPCYKMKKPKTKMKTLLDAYTEAKKYLNNVFLGNV